jgi:hypothetical protein
MTPVATREEAVSSLENDARGLAAVLEKRWYLVLILLTVVYLAGAVQFARSKPFWYDEIITLFAAGQPDVPAIWNAVEHVDINPPLPHLLTHFSIQWWGKNEVTARIPAMAGFWIFCLCLFHFTRRRLGICFALAALLLPINTEAYAYAVEARAYGLELGFCGLALVAWQAAADRSGRFWALPVLSVSLMAATLCHYYAALLWIPLAGGEAFRWYRTRRFDWGIWAAFVAGGAALVWRVRTIAGVGKWTTHTWSPATPGQVLEFWEAGLQYSLPYVALLLALLALSIVITRREKVTAPETTAAIEDHELIAGALFLALPVVAVGGGLFVTHIFTMRYAVFALTGFALLVPMVAAQLVRGRDLFGFLLVFVLLAALVIVTFQNPAPHNPFNDEPILQKALETDTVVISDGQLFLQMWQYAPEALKSRLLFVADTELAVQYMGFDTIDGGLLLLRPWSPAKVVEYKSFYAPGREFLVYQQLFRPGWLLTKVVKDGAVAKIEGAQGFRQLVRVRFQP